MATGDNNKSASVSSLVGASTDLIAVNQMIKEVRLLRRRHWSTWVTIWPFFILYCVTLTLYFYPELVWDRVYYLVYQTYIDFFHAICTPVVLFLHAFLALFTIWSVRFRALILFHRVSLRRLDEATDVLVLTHPHKGESEIVPLQQASADGHPPCFVFQQRKWKLSAEERRFVKPRFPTHEPFSFYIHWLGLRRADAPTMMSTQASASIEAQLDAFGTNRMEVTIPEFQDLFVDHALAPFFVFQMFCILLWCLDEYWYYSLFMGVMMVAMECVTVYSRIRNMRTLRDMAEIPVRDITVIRDGRRQVVRTSELLPMDLLVVPNNASCPVDAVLVRGTAVVNESTLTGESTPQLKEAPDDVDLALSPKKHARHMIFSGTHILLSSGPHQGTSGGDGAASAEPTTTAATNNALAVVLKTGFETKQGKLLRTILHSQGRVSENSGEAFGFIGVLVVFALAASGYLLRRGLADPTRSRWKLFLSCVQIITSVIPPELPMQLSLAVNTSLMALTKLQVFCTEPFRIPFAGKVDTCCFDKTGTLTTDEMLFGGVDMVDGNGLHNTLKTIPAHSEMVLATCHSLVYLDEHTLAGDEMEKAATSALGYRMHANDRVVYDPPPPKDGETAEEATKRATMASLTGTNSKTNSSGSSSSNVGGGSGGKKRSGVSKTSGTDPSRVYQILARFPFVAALRRMSCVVAGANGTFVVAKGSPEAIAGLCVDAPAQYNEVAERTAAQGYRVIALAYRELTAQEKGAPGRIAALRREEVERDMHFAGLAIYVSPLKKDARETILNLEGGSHRCVIITGDSVQTAISVGRDVAMLSCPRQLVVRPGQAGELRWADVVTGELLPQGGEDIIANTFVRSRWQSKPRAGQWDLCVNAENLSADFLARVIAEYSEQVRIWARCAPTQKEAIVTDLKKKGHIVLMAGDGTNDVGALKQAHAGIAVLNSAAVAAASTASEAEANLPRGPQPHNEPDVPAELKVPPGFKFTVVPPQPAPGTPFREMFQWKMAEAKRKQEIVQIKKWNEQLKKMAKSRADAKAAAPPPPPGLMNGSDFLMESLFNADDDPMGGGPPMIKLGDASIAAPFTCRSKALTSICDIVRLGRSTLVTTHMMFKILALNCLTSAYSMSVLHSDGVKLGEKQMILAGVILSVCFMCMSRSKPLTYLCPQRPVTKVFHPYMISTVFLQFALHLYSMMKTASMVAEVDMDTVLAMRQSVEEEKFKPTLLNSTMFLMTTLMSGVTFAVNYRGEPFMESIRKNRPMFIALIILCLVIVTLAAESDPELNKLFEIVAFPSVEFRQRFLKLLAIDAIGSFAIENVCLRLFTDY